MLIELRPIAPTRQTRRLRITADCGRQTDVSIGVSFRAQNRAQWAVLLLRITADCA